MTEFTCRSGGSNLNAGTLDGTNEASTTPLVTYASGTYDATTRVFTVASGNPVTDGVIAGTHWVGVSDGLASLRCVGVANSYATTPDSVPLSIVGDLDVRARLSLDDWTPSPNCTIVSKWTNSGQRSWVFRVTTSGVLSLFWSADGVTNAAVINSTTGLGLPDGAVKWVRVTLDVDNGAAGNDVKFYTSDDGSSWTQLGTTVTTAGVTSIFNGTDSVVVGGRADAVEQVVGKVYYAEVRDGIGGAIVASPDFSAQSPGATSFSDAQGNTWTVGSAASILAATSAQLIALVSARDATTITLDATRRSGGATSGTATLIVGGAWRGPNGTDQFPLNHVSTATVSPRINMKNDQTYSITAGITIPQAGPGIIQGYTSTFGDAGRFTLDGGTSGASYALLTLAANWQLWDFVLQNNGATGNASGITAASGVNCILGRGVVRAVRGNGVATSSGVWYIRDVECTGCNQNNTAGLGGLMVNGGAVIERCYFHDNSGSNAVGAQLVSTSDWVAFFDCIFDTNGSHGVRFSQNGGSTHLHNCDFYANGGSGIAVIGTSGTSRVVAENCNFVQNGGYGINASGAGQRTGRVINCGFGSGAAANASGTVNSLKGIDELSNVTYPSGQTPWADPANGDFRVTLAEAKDDGRGTLPTAGTTTSAPAIGAAQPTSVAATGRRRWGMFGLGLGTGVRVD